MLLRNSNARRNPIALTKTYSEERSKQTVNRSTMRPAGMLVRTLGGSVSLLVQKIAVASKSPIWHPGEATNGTGKVF